MVKNERLIKFPVPNWNRVTSKKFDDFFICLGYQYDFDGDFYGPYGFDTPASQDIMHSVIKSPYYYDDITNKFILSNTLKKKGVYFFDGFKNLKDEVENYQLCLKKNEIKIKKGLDSDELPAKPLLMQAINNGEFEDSLILKMMSDEIGFFIVNHYSPEAGQTILIPSEEFCGFFFEAAKIYNVQVVEVESINSLKPW
ncbi:hypothetical protein [Pantoea sp. FN0307]|uniref:hypothetical protein n=1 Tax=Pantoea sp. FN0307 TaxID=3418560 RepID=UPI003CF5A5FB